MRIVVSGGGTAGHISPTLATSDALKSLDKSAEILYVGQAGGMEAKIVVAAGLKFAAIRAGKFRRLHSASTLAKIFNPTTIGPNVRDAVRAVQGLGQSLRLLRSFKPDVVFAKGGYVAFPVGLAAKLLRIPLVIHESDVSPGLGSRVLGRWATKIAVGFPTKSYKDFDPERLVFTGNPVRDQLMHAHRLEGLAKFGLDDASPVLFVTGGSAGAQQINTIIVEALPGLLPVCQVLHLTGEGEYERVKFEVSRLGNVAGLERYHAHGFLMSEMALALAAADVVIARAGANTIAELAVLGKPTVLIPNYEMAGHQVENARTLSRLGAVRVLDGSKLTAAKLVGEVKHILGEPEVLERLRRGIRQFAKPEAARELARLILDVGRAGERTVRKPNEVADE